MAEIKTVLTEFPELPEPIMECCGNYGYTEIQMRDYAEAAVLSANAGKVDAVQALPTQIHMDEIDADAAGRDWLRQINVANPEFRMEWMPDEGSQAPRIKWRALFDQKQRLRYAYLLNRDLKNFTQVTFIDADLTVPSTTQQAIDADAVDAKPLTPDEISAFKKIKWAQQNSAKSVALSMRDIWVLGELGDRLAIAAQSTEGAKG